MSGARRQKLLDIAKVRPDPRIGRENPPLSAPSRRPRGPQRRDPRVAEVARSPADQHDRLRDFLPVIVDFWILKMPVSPKNPPKRHENPDTGAPQLSSPASPGAPLSPSPATPSPDEPLSDRSTPPPYSAQALPELVKPQVKTTVEGRRIIKGPAVGARQVLAWKKEFADKGM